MAFTTVGVLIVSLQFLGMCQCLQTGLDGHEPGGIPQGLCPFCSLVVLFGGRQGGRSCSVCSVWALVSCKVNDRGVFSVYGFLFVAVFRYFSSIVWCHYLMVWMPVTECM